ncbi:hypothetical protein [Streptomyces sp. NPDC019937]|uniref:hypothetical protein n=1 Tax=Streptomyces sp. NPDC019937 TaxID=3154787 RepID=UPI00340D996A
MGVTYTVQGDSEGETRVELERLCAALGAEPLGRPAELPGRPRWMARARPASAPEPATAGQE